jgi:ABC-type branched-subunit amino acid transport system ATPase component
MNTKTQTQIPTQIQIRVRNVQLERKTVLYGPNGAGKSLIIRSILSAITTRRSIDVGLVEVEATTEPVSVVMIDESGVKQLGVANIFSLNEFTFADWTGVAVVNPAVAKRLSLEVYYDKYYDPDREWIPLAYMSYGEKRRLAIEATLSVARVVLIENFEAGLHVDYIVDLVKQIAESDATVILETHSGLVLRAAQRYGLAMYYVEPLARLKRIEKLDDPQMFGMELSTWNAIVVRP